MTKGDDDRLEGCLVDVCEVYSSQRLWMLTYLCQPFCVLFCRSLQSTDFSVRRGVEGREMHRKG